MRRQPGPPRQARGGPSARSASSAQVRSPANVMATASETSLQWVRILVKSAGSDMRRSPSRAVRDGTLALAARELRAHLLAAKQIKRRSIAQSQARSSTVTARPARSRLRMLAPPPSESLHERAGRLEGSTTRGYTLIREFCPPAALRRVRDSLRRTWYPSRSPRVQGCTGASTAGRAQRRFRACARASAGTAISSAG